VRQSDDRITAVMRTVIEELVAAASDPATARTAGRAER
jgi:hypothetical protein